MSGPVQPQDEACSNAPRADVEVREGRRTSVGGLAIARVLPTKGRRTVGAWCFTDLMLPSDSLNPDPMEIGPHPHIGLQTVTWLLEGEAVHTDSLGTEQLIRPGQLNLMTAGGGIAHAELERGLGLRGIQMWVALPESTRHGEPAFEHHPDLPSTPLGKVFMGTLADVASPARHDTPLTGAQLTLGAGQTRIPLDPAFEYAVVPLDNPVKVGEAIVDFGWLGYVPPGSDLLTVEAQQPGSSAMLLGGEPFEPVRMWWNFVARTEDELTQAYRDWQAHNDDRFAAVPSGLARIDAPKPPWIA